MLGGMANWGPVLRQVVEAGLNLLTPRPTGRVSIRSAPTGDRARRVVYAPDLDGAADPGEVVWAWVPFEERPVLAAPGGR